LRSSSVWLLTSSKTLNCAQRSVLRVRSCYQTTTTYFFFFQIHKPASGLESFQLKFHRQNEKYKIVPVDPLVTVHAVPPLVTGGRVPPRPTNRDLSVPRWPATPLLLRAQELQRSMSGQNESLPSARAVTLPPFAVAFGPTLQRILKRADASGGDETVEWRDLRSCAIPPKKRRTALCGSFECLGECARGTGERVRDGDEDEDLLGVVRGDLSLGLIEGESAQVAVAGRPPLRKYAMLAEMSTSAEDSLPPLADPAEGVAIPAPGVIEPVVYQTRVPGGAGGRGGGEEEGGDDEIAGGEGETWNGFQCQLCDTILTRRTDLRRHVKVVHYGERQSVCPICSKAFGRNANMVRHLRLVHR
jgi:uncharacterized C2H2 Zn-finger protein